MNSEAGPKHWRIRLQTLYKSQSTEQKASLRAQLKEGFERKALRSVSDRTYDRWLNNEVDPGKEHADFAYAVR